MQQQHLPQVLPIQCSEYDLNKMQTDISSSIYDRLQHLFNDPFQLQDLVFKEKSQLFNRPVDFLAFVPKHNSVTVVSLIRFFFSYRSGEFHLRLVNCARGLKLFVIPPEFSERFAHFSVDVDTKISPLAAELFNLPFHADYPLGYAMLVYDATYKGWEYVGCLAPLHEKVESTEVTSNPDPVNCQMSTSKKLETRPDLSVSHCPIIRLP